MTANAERPLLLRKPSSTITVLFCPVCGRDDRFQQLGAVSHFAGGKKCHGIPRGATYRLDRKAWDRHLREYVALLSSRSVSAGSSE